MKKVSDLYEAEASNIFDLALRNVGFKVPEYQRPYDWSKEDIERLYCGCLNGLYKFSTNRDHNALTFLGTLILVSEKKSERSFTGESWAIIDGQQRLTTLALLACALCESLRCLEDEVNYSTIDLDTSEWLKQEVRERQLALHMCAIGSQQIGVSTSYPFPRIVRHNDTRGKNALESEYQSPIARFLKEFSNYVDGEDLQINVPTFEDNDKKLEANFEIIRRLLSRLNEPSWYEEKECEVFDVSLLGRCRDFFERLPDIRDPINPDKLIDRVIKNQELHALLRTLMFAAYFCKCVVLTRVTTDDESAAFDIFDSLNTTGQPLTALETLKPRVISVETGPRSSYAGSVSEQSFKVIERNIDSRFVKTRDKQHETKELVVTVALHVTGEKVTKDLSSQRAFLRTRYDRALKINMSAAQGFLSQLANISTFRRKYWGQINDDLREYHQEKVLDEVRLLTMFVRDMRTSLALPILARYWKPGIKVDGDRDFLKVLRAIVAFLVIRRAWTGGTDGVDADLRSVMANNDRSIGKRRLGLNAGLGGDRDVLAPSELMLGLQGYLMDKLGKYDKRVWTKRVADQPLYQYSKELVRFMILCAAHQCLPSKKIAGTWEKEGVRADPSARDYLTPNIWQSHLYRTVEHVAPAKKPEGEKWLSDLYQDARIRHSIGNLALLPSRENSAIGNAPWKKKRLFYLAVTENRREEQERWIKQAEKAGIAFGKTTLDLLERREVLSLLDPLRDVQKWDKELVQLRSENIASLCWDHIWPWLEH